MAVDILATSDDERFLRWVEWLHGITDETFTLFHHRHLWGELAEISRNAALPPSAIFDAFGTWYGASQAVAVRRQLDGDRRSVSFVRLLTNISEHPRILSRERHCALWSPEIHWQQRAHANFDRIAGVGAKAIAAELLHVDIEALKHDCKPVKKYVDKVVAHTDEERLQNLLTYRELNDAAGTLGKLLQKYTSLLKATVVELTPVIQHDWKAPFRKSWLPPL